MASVELRIGALRATPPVLHSYYRLLSGDERTRADRFALNSDRARFIAAHGLTRLILAGRLKRSPSSVVIARTNAGKPFLPDDDLSFSVSHSRSLLCCALTNGADIGVDVERMRLVDYSTIAVRFLAPEEEAELRRADSMGEGLERFFRLWTLKEALIKAVGGTVPSSLRAFAVTSNGRAPALVRIDGRSGERAAWSLGHFQLAGGHVGAVAVAGSIDGLICRPYCAR
jgi:4'-phosphopantetheinyl transferase